VNKTLADDEVFLVNYYLTDEKGQIMPAYRRVERHKAKEVDVLLRNFDIRKLPSGNYLFKLELINKDNKVIAEQQYFFQRENTRIKLNEEDLNNIKVINTFAELITGQDTLADVIYAMRPIMSANEVDLGEELIKKGDEKLMQQFIYSFWYRRNNAEPSKPFIAYMKQVMKVNNEFSTSIKKGYETDRGYVYLKYGEPNNINKQYNEPATYPYEIWQYYSARGQSNVRFVFYNPDLVTNDFQLLHSNAIGEVSNYQWRLQLRKRDQSWRSIDQTGEETDEWGTHYNDYYNQPR
jgi:GWxTD domain-containing protein